MNYPFITACKEGNLEEAINIYNKDKPNIYSENDEVYRDARYFNKTNIIKWLKDIGHF